MKIQLNKFITHTSLLLFFVLIISSCKKEFLDREPYGGLPTNESITTVEDMEIALNGAYANLRSPNLYGRTIPLFGDLAADNVYISTTNSNRYLDFFQVNYTVNNTNAEGIWQTAYNTILNVNNVINSSLQGSPEINQLRGEALAIRALMYFELVKHFSKPYTVDPNALGVPLILTYDPFLKPQRNTLTEVYAQIKKDLDAAIPLLTISKSSGYFTQYAARALLARMHQFKGEWASALSVARDVINTSGYTLLGLNQYFSYWSSNTARTDRLETLFEVVSDLVGNAGNDALAYFYDQAGYGDALAAQSLYNLYAATDVRRGLILSVQHPDRGNIRVVNKYPNSTQPDKDEFKVLRLSEVYLIAAEAAYHTNNEPLALTYLNDVATRRDAGFTGYTATGTALLENILLERRKELAFEGHRYWDLARYNRNIMRVNLANNYPGVPLVIAANNFRRILPIPQSELDANPNIRSQQNAGY
ncbi:MAG TPA: RagB/SusD family nutrient uptake outer membrane protein [Chitinophagaceae bacterium]|nr:RagB/SusD family nutrient uptake outer membrane protein [Chitinophagaceae bacterium]